MRLTFYHIINPYSCSLNSLKNPKSPMILSQLRRPGLQNAGPPAGGFGEAESTVSCPGGRCGRAIRGPPCCALSNIDKPNCVATEMGCYWGVCIYIYIYIHTIYSIYATLMGSGSTIMKIIVVIIIRTMIIIVIINNSNSTQTPMFAQAKNSVNTRKFCTTSNNGKDFMFNYVEPLTIQ